MDTTEYAARRDVFTTAVNALRDAESEFCEAVDDWNDINGHYDVARQLDAEGKTLTGDEYERLQTRLA